MRVLLMLAGAVVVGALVWVSVAADWWALANDGGWWALVGLAFPALIAFGVWRGWDV